VGDEGMKRQISEYIRSDAVNKTINPEKQAIHNRDNERYIAGRSYLLPGVNAQELVDKYHGTGDIKTKKATGEWKKREVIIAGRDIGVEIDPKTGAETITNRFTIHYSNTGTHIVPTKRM
jgi:hypothetical protein